MGREGKRGRCDVSIVEDRWNKERVSSSPLRVHTGERRGEKEQVKMKKEKRTGGRLKKSLLPLMCTRMRMRVGERVMKFM